MPAQIQVDQSRIAEFCRRWRITEFSLFGSVLREDFGPQSDIDVLVRLDPGARHSLFDLVHMQDELKSIFGRNVDLVDRRALEAAENYIRRRHILSTAETIHVAG